jgi:hypothetical protein
LKRIVEPYKVYHVASDRVDVVFVEERKLALIGMAEPSFRKCSSSQFGSRPCDGAARGHSGLCKFSIDKNGKEGMSELLAAPMQSKTIARN